MSTTETEEPNEIVAATRAAKLQQDAAGLADWAKDKRWPIASIGLGIGSAAVVAALLFANRGKKK